MLRHMQEVSTQLRQWLNNVRQVMSKDLWTYTQAALSVHHFLWQTWQSNMQAMDIVY